MKTVLQVLGVIFIVLLIVVAGYAGYTVYDGRHLDASSKAYVDAAVPAIVKNWSQSELESRAAPQLIRGEKPAQLTKFFHWLSSLGRMKTYCGSKGQANIYFSPQGRTISARYTACVHFENGDAKIKVLLLHEQNDSWKIAGFHVYSKELASH